MTEKINSIFEKDWWLNAIVGDSWERLTIKKKNGDIAASFPIYKTKLFGRKILTVPPLTQTLGLYIENTGAKLTKQLEKSKKLTNEIIGMLPNDYQYDFYLDANNEYVLPFIWAGFKVEPMFSYRIESFVDLDSVWAGFKENIKTDIRKAEKCLTIKEENDIQLLIKMQKKTFERQNRTFPLDVDLISRLDCAATNNESKLLLCAYDDDNNLHAATYFVFDDKRCYYLMSGGDPEYRNSGATSLLIWEAMKRFIGRVEIFDFEGSMIEDIERFVRGFGAKPNVYYHISKTKGIISFVKFIKPRVKKLLHYK